MLPSARSLTRPLSAMDHRGRRERLRERLRAMDVDAMLVTAPNDVRYLSGFSGSSGSVIVLTGAQDDVLVTDPRYRERVTELDIPEVELAHRAAEVLQRRALGSVAIDAGHLTVASARSLTSSLGGGIAVVETSDVVATLRSTKDDAEIERLERACAITARALAWLITGFIRPGRSEIEVARAMEHRMVDLGAEGVAFPTIVASGPNASSPHHLTGQRALESGDLVVVDAGAVIDGYCADMTRTVGVGIVDRFARRLHAAVVDANEAGRAAAHPGATPGIIHASATQVLLERGFGEHIAHPTGQGVGLDIHERPLIGSGNEAPLVAGCVFTVEPGLYVPGTTGVRVEDTLVFGSDVPTVLTELPRHLDELASLDEDRVA